MRTTIDLPDELVERVKISAAKGKTTMRELVIRGLEEVLDGKDDDGSGSSSPDSALERLREGYSLKHKRFTREELHAR